MRPVLLTIQRINELLLEFEVYYNYKEVFLNKIKRLEKELSEQKIDELKYASKLKAILGDKNKESWLRYYNSYIIMILKEIELLNSHLKDLLLRVPSHIEIMKKEELKKSLVKKTEKVEEYKPIIPEALQFGKKKNRIPEAKEGIRKEVKVKTGIKTEKKGNMEQDIKQEVKENVKLKLRLKSKQGINTEKQQKEELSYKKMQDIDLNIPSFSELVEKKSILKEEIKKVENILKKRKVVQVYKASFIGSFVNPLFRETTKKLIKTYPNVFKKLYDSLRLSNIHVLSNTYINIMVFFSVLSFVISIPVFLIIYIYTFTPLIVSFVKSFILSVLIFVAVSASFYLYPITQIKIREKNIRRNLPFAITHLAAVSTSSVPPAKMFKLVSDTPDYGEMSVEIGKIVDFIEVFGYDLISALKTVANTTPSHELKDFLEGFSSTISSGGDLSRYLNGQASESMRNYELEREKYSKIASTYSDVYTGLIIAGPLFFIVALSLVGILGGQIIGFSVNTIILFGTYMIIPLANVLFMIFLSTSEPKV